MLCFSLYAASRATSQAYRAVLVEHDLTYPQFLVLVALDDQGDSTVAELGQLMFLDSGTLSPLVKRLERRGLVTRTRPANNERVLIVGLTDEGIRVREEIADAVQPLTPAYGVDAAGLAELLPQLHAIRNGMTDLTESLRTTNTKEPTL